MNRKYSWLNLAWNIATKNRSREIGSRFSVKQWVQARLKIAKTATTKWANRGMLHYSLLFHFSLFLNFISVNSPKVSLSILYLSTIQIQILIQIHICGSFHTLIIFSSSSPKFNHSKSFSQFYNIYPCSRSSLIKFYNLTRFY